jgi:hypothetical protein
MFFPSIVSFILSRDCDILFTSRVEKADDTLSASKGIKTVFFKAHNIQTEDLYIHPLIIPSSIEKKNELNISVAVKNFI